MAPRTRDQRLFGAACLKTALARTAGVGVAENEIYQGALRDLSLTDAEVEAYLAMHRDEVVAALDAGRGIKDTP